jgi:hypothetical protein
MYHRTIIGGVSMAAAGMVHVSVDVRRVRRQLNTRRMEKRILTRYQDFLLVRYEPSGEVRIARKDTGTCSMWLAPSDVDAIRARPEAMRRYDTLLPVT